MRTEGHKFISYLLSRAALVKESYYNFTFTSFLSPWLRKRKKLKLRFTWKVVFLKKTYFSALASKLNVFVDGQVDEELT